MTEALTLLTVLSILVTAIMIIMWRKKDVNCRRDKERKK